MNLIGYLNRRRSFPAPLISVGQEGDRFVAIYPSGDCVGLRDIHSEEALRQRQAFVAPSAEGPKDVPELAYGLREGLILTGSRAEVGRRLRAHLRTLGNLVDDSSGDAIRDFLIAIKEFVGSVSGKELMDAVKDKPDIVVSIRERQLRRREGRAATLTVQLHRRGRLKTLFKKGIPRGKRVGEVRVSADTFLYFQRDLFPALPAPRNSRLARQELQQQLHF